MSAFDRYYDQIDAHFAHQAAKGNDGPATRQPHPQGIFHCLACEAPTHKRENLCLECEQQVEDGLEERRLQDAGQ